MSKSNRKVLLWLQKHYIHPEFKPSDAFLSILYMFILWDTKGEKNLEKQLKLGFIIARTFLLVWFVLIHHNVVTFVISGVQLERCIYINGFCHRLPNQLHKHLRIISTVL